eukprot:s1192_g3.t1
MSNSVECVSEEEELPSDVSSEIELPPDAEPELLPRSASARKLDPQSCCKENCVQHLQDSQSLSRRVTELGQALDACTKSQRKTLQFKMVKEWGIGAASAWRRSQAAAPAAVYSEDDYLLDEPGDPDHLLQHAAAQNNNMGLEIMLEGLATPSSSSRNGGYPAQRQLTEGEFFWRNRCENAPETVTEMLTKFQVPAEEIGCSICGFALADLDQFKRHLEGYDHFQQLAQKAGFPASPCADRERLKQHFSSATGARMTLDHFTLALQNAQA